MNGAIMYNSTKMYIKNQLIQLINQCDDKSTKQGRVTLDDIRDIIDELEDDNMVTEFEKDMKELGWTEFYAKTGAFTLNNVEFIYDEIDYGNNVIDLTLEEMEKQFYDEVRNKYNDEHPDNELPSDYDFDEDPLELVDYLEKEYYMDCCDSHNYLINYIPDPEFPGEYIEDPDAEYSAYIGESDGFVTMSKYVCKAAKGSPCIPNQCCLDDEYSVKTEWAFTLPPEIWGINKPEGTEIIKINTKIYNLSGILNKLGGI